jgi:hypothetical protein
MVLHHEDVTSHICAHAGKTQLDLHELLACMREAREAQDRSREAQDRSREAQDRSRETRDRSTASSKPNSLVPKHPFQLPVSFDALSADRVAVRERRAGLESVCRIAYAALALFECEAWKAFGYRQRNDYCRERLDLTLRWLDDAAALGRGLRSFPELERAVAGLDGAPLGRVAATAIARIATPDSIAAWIRRGRELTVRELLTEIQTVRSAGGTAPLESLTEETPSASERRTLHETEPEIEETESTRMRCSRRVLAIFQDVFDLHRALNGYDTNITSFMDALQAEWAAEGLPMRKAALTSRDEAPSIAAVENAWSHKTRRWADLKFMDELETSAETLLAGALVPSSVLSDARSAALMNEWSIEVPNGIGASWPGGRVSKHDVRVLEERLFEAIQDERLRERRVAKILLRRDEAGHWKGLGFESAGHYAVERLGIARRTAESYIYLLRGLRQYPVLLAAYENGRLGHGAACVLYRLRKDHGGNPTLDAKWVRQASQHSVKRLQQEHRRAWLRALNAGEQSSLPEPASDAEWHASLHRKPGMSRERIRRLHFLRLETGWSAELSGRQADVCVRWCLPVETSRAFWGAVESARRAMAEMMRGLRPRPQYLPGKAPASFRAAQYFERRKEGIPAWIGLLVLLENYVETHDDPRAFPKRAADDIYERDGFTCMAPGCTARCAIEDHHIKYRSRRGSNEPWNRLCLCRFHHHQGEHGELAKCWGKAPLDVTWRLGTRELATWWRNERKLSALEVETAARERPSGTSCR